MYAITEQTINTMPGFAGVCWSSFCFDGEVPDMAKTKSVSEVVSFADQVEEEFLRLYDSLDVSSAPEKRKADIIDSIWGEIYGKVFKPSPDDVLMNNCKSKLTPWKVEDVEAVTDMFIRLNRRYGGVIKYNIFSELTGISRETVDRWHRCNNSGGYIFNLSESDIKDEYNNLYIIYNTKGEEIIYNGNAYRSNDKASYRRYDVKKKLREAMQDSNTNGLSNDTTGHMVRANNEPELGKLYEPRRMIQHEQIKQALSVGDLPSAAEIEAAITPNRIAVQDNVVDST